jgi:hypothetical protein
MNEQNRHSGQESDPWKTRIIDRDIEFYQSVVEHTADRIRRCELNQMVVNDLILLRACIDGED